MFCFCLKSDVLWFSSAYLGLFGENTCQLLKAKKKKQKNPPKNQKKTPFNIIRGLELEIKILNSKKNEKTQVEQLEQWMVFMFTRFYLSCARSLGSVVRQVW